MKALILIGIILISSSVILVLWFAWFQHKALSAYKKSLHTPDIREEYLKAS